MANYTIGYSVTVNGTLTSSSTITGLQNFQSSTTSAFFGTTGAGTVALRPNGVGSATGQVTVNSAGAVTTNGALTANGTAIVNCLTTTDYFGVVNPGTSPAGSFVYITSPAAAPGFTGNYGGLARADIKFNNGSISFAVSATTSGTSDNFTFNSSGGFTATGSIVSGATIQSAQNFQAAGAAVVLQPASTGTCYLRPVPSSVTGQMTVGSTGNVTVAGSIICATGNISFGSVAASGPTDLSNHIALYGTTYGFDVTSLTLNYVSASAHKWYAGSTNTATLDSSGNFITAGAVVSSQTFQGAGAAVVLQPGSTGTCYLRPIPNSATAQTTVSSNGNMAVAGIVTSNGDELGFREVPITAQNANYTAVADDSGRCRSKTGTTAWTYTINNSVFGGGEVLTLTNQGASGNITIAAGSGVTLRLAGTATTGNRTLAPFGVATIYMQSATVGLVSGPGVT